MSTINAGERMAIRAVERPGHDPTIVVRRREGWHGRCIARLVNAERLLPGDRVRLVARGGLNLRVSGSAIVEGTDNPRLSYLTVYDPGILTIHVIGSGRAWIEWEVPRPTLPPNPIEGGPVIGPLQPQLVVGTRPNNTPYHRWFDAVDMVAASGCNLISASPLAYWNPASEEIGCPFAQVPDGRVDLRWIDPLWEKLMRALLWRCDRARIACDIYPFDFVTGTHPEQWARSPLNAINNVRGWIPDEEGAADGAPLTAPHHWLHAAVKAGPTSPPYSIHSLALGWLIGYVGALDRLQPNRGRHTLVPILEGTSRTFDLFWMDRIGGPRGSNLRQWWDPADRAELLHNLRDDPGWRALANRLDLVVLHGCDAGSTAPLIGDLPRVLSPATRIRVSTDGAGMGSQTRRPEGTRPSAEDHAAIWREGLAAAGERFAGLEIKLVDSDDPLAFMASVVALIDRR